MTLFFKLIAWVLSPFGIVFLDTLIRELLPYPANRLNAVFLVAAVLLIITSHPRSAWSAVPAALILSLFSPTGFGLSALALMVSIVAMAWLQHSLLASRSSYLAGVIGLSGLAVYRLIFFLAVTIESGGPTPLISTAILAEWFWEALLTSGCISIIAALAFISNRRLKPLYVRE